MTNETAKDAARRLSVRWRWQGYEPTGLFEYVDAHDKVLMHRMRLEHPTNPAKKKVIQPFRRSGKGYRLGEPKWPNKRPLYGLARLMRNPGAEVFVVEVKPR